MWVLLLFLLVVQAAVGTPVSRSQKTHRLPFQKKDIVLESPTNYEKRVLGYDPKSGEPIYYDPKPRVVVLDAKSGKYGLKWVGSDGREKTIIYQRPDAIDAVVSASVSRTASGQYVYRYNIQNLPSSGQQLSGFAVQNFASEVKPVRMANIHIGQMSNNQEMNDGNWIRFGIFSEYKLVVIPGRSIEFRLESPGPPGLVECRIHGGVMKMKGVGEEPPPELMDILPGYEAWPSGYTIGPVDSLKALSPGKRAVYLRKRLSRFQRLGWITAESVPWYQQNLRGDNLERVLKRAKQDFKAGKITSEVLGMIRYLLRPE